MISTKTWGDIGSVLAISGSSLNIAGILVNNLFLSHKLAMWFWFGGNPLLLAWALGFLFKKWNGGLSATAVAVMYCIAWITGAYGLWIS
jgi:hypothetical protein